MSSRLLIPKNLGLYLLYFIGSLCALAAMVRFYYAPPELSDAEVSDALGFLDLTRTASLFHWFLSILWLITGGVALVTARFSGTLRGGGLKPMFWMSIAVLSLLASADAVCGFSPLLQQLADQKVVELAGDETGVSMTRWILGVIGTVFILTYAGYLWRYIRAMRGSRMILRFCFYFAAFWLGLGVTFRYTIPNPDGGGAEPPRSVARRESDNPADSTARPRSTPSTTQEKSGGSEKSSPKKDSAKSEEKFRVVAYEKEGTSAQSTGMPSYSDKSSNESVPSESLTRWEDIFGWEKSVEENLGLGTTLETMVGLEEPLETFLLRGDMKLDPVRTREILRRGIWGLFLIFFSTGLALLARAERVQIDQHFQFGRFRGAPGPDSMTPGEY